jgi:hypothetical protein
MKEALFGAAVATLLLSGAYYVGRSQAQPLLEAQGRGAAIPPIPRSEPPLSAEQPMVYGGESGAVADSSNGFMAVTGSYGVGTSVLYLIDTETKQLLAYEARGGSRSMRRLVLVGARRIDLDLQLIDYHDVSEYTRDDLRQNFLKSAKDGAGGQVPAQAGGVPPAASGGSVPVKKR